MCKKSLTNVVHNKNKLHDLKIFRILSLTCMIVFRWFYSWLKIRYSKNYEIVYYNKKNKWIKDILTKHQSTSKNKERHDESACDSTFLTI